ncbi:hypothetical protein [Candidatus Seribacter sulfatis]|uniref:hypothetical protein n=1 Tax=Candidatus Seribacter sulfatis TaxID=3381756 RepID=UPI00389A6E07
MDTLTQKALDYTLGVLPKEESLLFEAMLEENDEARNSLAQAQEDCANLALSSKPKSLGKEVRSRILENCQPSLCFDSFLSSESIQKLHRNFSRQDERYQGGGGCVPLKEIQSLQVQDELYQLYEDLLVLSPLVAGDSNAAAGDMSGLQKVLHKSPSFSQSVDSLLSHSIEDDRPVAQSVQRSLLSSMPSLSFFSDRLKGDSFAMGDVRRLFYLCRDQLKIMRASFGDIDPPRLVEDEKLRLHSAGLLKTKWWGAEHAYFSSQGKVRCGHFFDGPVTERCVEFAEYDANMYCLANLLSPRSANGEFHMELIKDAVPDCILAIAKAETKKEKHEEIEEIVHGINPLNPPFQNDQVLWNLIEESMTRAHQHASLSELREACLFGCQRMENSTYLWFAWPAIENAHDGAEA